MLAASCLAAAVHQMVPAACPPATLAPDYLLAASVLVEQLRHLLWHLLVSVVC
jgi:hypothetical protein